MLDVIGLRTYYYTGEGTVKAVDGVDLSIGVKETVGLVGESGCGKSTIGLSLMRLIPPSGEIVGGHANFFGRDLFTLGRKEMRKVRGGEISMIFQDPASSLNPVLNVRDQIGEAIRIHQIVKGKKDIGRRCAKILGEVGISDTTARLTNYPHELSGGMQQRVMIAIALSCQPKLLIADEPTSSLDVTIEAQILDLLRELRGEFGLSILMISHDLGVIAEMADKIVVMYAGKGVESAPALELFDNPCHPYTKALLKAIPKVEGNQAAIEPIPGRVPSLIDQKDQCLFSPRCRYASSICRSQAPSFQEVSAEHIVACHLFSGENGE